MNNPKQDVHDFWNLNSCGEQLFLAGADKAAYAAQASARYALEPYILDFAGFKDARDLKVLEIGVGLGADHQQFAEVGADLWGIDLTERAIEHTQERFAVFGLPSRLSVAMLKTSTSLMSRLTVCIHGVYYTIVRIRQKPLTKFGEF